MKARVEQVKTLPAKFRPVHATERVASWEGVQVVVRGRTHGEVRGAVKDAGTLRLFVTIDSGSMWVTEQDVEIMEEHSSTDTFQDEPKDGWVTGQDLFDTEVITTTLCRYTGDQLGPNMECIYRRKRQHPDVNCVAFYHLADAIVDGRVALTAEVTDAIAQKVTADPGDAEPTLHEPLS